MDKEKIPTAAAVSAKLFSMKPSNVRMLQNFLLIWLDGSIDEISNDDERNPITKFRQVVNNVNTFTDADECVKFIDRVKEENVFMIKSGALGQTTVPAVHDKSQISSIYIYCGNKARHEKWARQWPKVKGVFTDIKLICEALKQSAQDCDKNLISISLLKTTDGNLNQNIDQLDPSFMYTQILKEILLTIDFDQGHINDFLAYCREQFINNSKELKNVDKIEKEYRHHEPIWWYTYQCFLYSMLNRTLRTMEVDIIIKLGFFVRDLHQHIVTLHSNQYGHSHRSPSFTVFRGQCMSQLEVDQLIKTKDGLLSFNNFLSTSTQRSVSLDFARRTVAISNLIGILFVITIDLSVPLTPFANIRDVSYYEGEEEILFSMHSIFRIGHMEQIDENKCLWQVNLTLTSDNDPQLHALTERMRKDIFPDKTGWYRLGEVLIIIGQFHKAQQLYEVLLSQASDERHKSDIYDQFGYIKEKQGEYDEAIFFYKQAFEIKQKYVPPIDPCLVSSLNNISLVYEKMGNYSKALSHCELAVEISEKMYPPDHPRLATPYTNIGLIFNKMGEYQKALSYYERSLEINIKTLPSNHPRLATSYSNISTVYKKIGEYSKALSYGEKALEIRQKFFLHAIPI